MIVYRITNRANGKSYIGITSKRLLARWHRHVADAREGAPNPLQRAIRKYGVDAFSREVIYEADSREEALVVERGLIAAHATFAPNGYNVTLGGGGTPGWKASEETKRRASERLKGIKPACAGQPMPQSAKDAIRAAAYARSPHSLEKIATAKGLVLAGYPVRWISRQLGIDRTTVKRIGSGRVWGSVAAAPIVSLPEDMLAAGAAAKAAAEKRKGSGLPKPAPKAVGRPKGCRMTAEAKARISAGLKIAYAEGRHSRRRRMSAHDT